MQRITAVLKFTKGRDISMLNYKSTVHLWDLISVKVGWATLELLDFPRLAQPNLREIKSHIMNAP